MKKNLFRFLGILLLPLLTLSCNPLIDSLLTKENQSGKCIVSGSIVNTLDSNDARAAASVKRSTEKYFYKISCECTEPSETFTEIVDTNTFSLSLDPGTWTFSVTGYLVSSKEEITDTSVPVLVTTTPQTKTISQNVTLDNFNLSLNTGKTANISLKVDVSGTAIKSCKMTLTSLTNPATTYNKTFTPTAGIISLEDAVSSGYYSMTLDFYDNTGAAGTLLYTARERLTVYPGATTLETDPYFVKWSYSNNKLVISNDTINNKSNHNVYVKSDASSNGTKGTKFDPFKTLSDAYNYINSVNNGTDNNYSIILMNDFTASDTTNPLLSIASAKSLNLEICSDSTNNYKIENTGSKCCINITGSSTVNVTLNNITITGATPGTTGAPSDATGVYINNSSATLQIEGNTTVSSIGLGIDNPVQILTPVDSSTSFMLIPSSYTEGKVVLEGSGVSTIYGNVTVRDESVEGGSKKQWSVGSDGKLCKPVKNAYLSKLNFVPNKSSSNDEDKTVYVKTPADLKALADFVNTGTNADSTVSLTDQTFDGITIIQENDISLSEYSNWEPIGKYENSTTYYFKGTYDGAGKEITGLSINTSTANSPALFGNVDSAVIKGVSVSGSVTCSANDYVGGIVNNLKNSTVSDCVSKVDITYSGSWGGSSVGGIAARGVNTCTILNCTNNGSINYGIGKYVGGIVGDLENNTSQKIIRNCINEGTISSTTNTASFVGGIAGYAPSKSTLENSLNKGEIKGKDTSSSFGAGLIGQGGSSSDINTINNCVNVGQISNFSKTAAFVGKSNAGSGANLTITKCYNDSSKVNDLIGTTDYDESYTTITAYENKVYSSETEYNPLVTALNSWVTANNTGSDLVYKNWAYDNTNGLHFAETASGGDEGPKVYMNTLSDPPVAGSKVYVGSEDDIDALRYFVNAGNSLAGVTIIQDNQIDLQNGWTPIGRSSSEQFSGTYDGQGNPITNFSPYDGNATSDFAFFGVTNNATIKNMNLSGSITGNQAIKNLYLGGIVCQSKGGEISGCKVNVNISSGSSGTVIGGIASYIETPETGYEATKINNCVNYGTMEITQNNEVIAGGIVGKTKPTGKEVVIINCVNNGEVKYTGTKVSKIYLGGIVGYADTNSGNSITVKNCGNKGIVTNTNNDMTTYTIYLGGIIGYESNTKTNNVIENCFNIGKISGANMSYAIVATKETQATISYCYWNSNETGCSKWKYDTSDEGENIYKLTNNNCDLSAEKNVFGVSAWYLAPLLNAWVTQYTTQENPGYYKTWAGTANEGKQGIPSLPIEN